MKKYLVVASCLVACGYEDPIVGGECLAGYREVSGSCVPTADAGDAAGSGGAGSNGADSDGAGSDGSGADGSGSDGSGAGWGGATSSGPQGASGGGGGDASASSSGGSESSGGACGEGESYCGDACIDVSSDPLNCGGCGVVCASGICADGQCEGAFAGHVVLCGFEADRLAALTPSRIAGNAVFAWPIDPVRVGFLVDAGAPSVAILQDVVSREAFARGRTVTLEAITDGDTMEQRLGSSSLDVAVVGALPQGDDAVALGLLLAGGFSDLTARGGVIVLLAPTNASSMGSFLEAANVAEDVEGTPAALQPLDVVAFDDALAAGLPSVFARPPGTLAFDAPDLGGRVVVADRSGRAVVVHGVVEP